MDERVQALRAHQTELQACRRCPDMVGPVIVGVAARSPVMLMGQAPGEREGALGRPFAWTAGKTLFGWFERIGMDEQRFRQSVFMNAVCRCFPGKHPRGGDRVPSRQEIAVCAEWMQAEFELVRPRLVIPVGKLAIQQLLPVSKLTDVVGSVSTVERNSREIDVIPLPHPSGASTWHRTAPGKTLLDEALLRIERHPAWQLVLARS